MESNTETKSESGNLKTGCLGFVVLFAIGMWCMRGIGSNENNSSENENKPENIINEFPDFKYEIIGDLKGFNSNGVVKADVVFIKVNSCDEEKLKYLQKELQKNNLFPPKFKSGKFEIKVFYEFKIFMVENIEQNVDLKNVKSLYDSSSSMVELNNYLRKNTKGFCAMLYKMWDYPTYEENFGMFMRP